MTVSLSKCLLTSHETEINGYDVMTVDIQGQEAVVTVDSDDVYEFKVIDQEVSLDRGGCCSVSGYIREQEFSDWVEHPLDFAFSISRPMTEQDVATE